MTTLRVGRKLEIDYPARLGDLIGELLALAKSGSFSCREMYSLSLRVTLTR